MKLGEELVSIREQQSISQRQLAKAAGVTNSTISRIEANLVNPDLGTLEKILDALNISLLDFLVDVDFLHVSREFIEIERKLNKLDIVMRKEAVSKIVKIINDYSL